MNAIIMTHGDRGTPHLNALKQSNPDSAIHIAHSPETGESKTELWKNSDRFMVDWWRANGDDVQGDVVAVMEYDALVMIPMPEIPAGVDLAARFCAPIRTRRGEPIFVRDKYEWCGPSPAALMLSFGFFLCRRWVLNAVSDPKWDFARALSIQNEVRFPSIAMAEGAKLGRLNLPNVSCRESPPYTGPSIYHSVKA